MSLREKLERLPADAFREERIQITPLRNEADLIYALFDCKLKEDQVDLVNPASFSIGRAYLSRERNVPCLIRNEQGEPIGFISLNEWIGKSSAYSWSYFLDQNAQGRGYGRAAAELAIRLLNAADPDMPIRLSAEVSNADAHRLYCSLGFRLLEEKDGDDLMFERSPEESI